MSSAFEGFGRQFSGKGKGGCNFQLLLKFKYVDEKHFDFDSFAKSVGFGHIMADETEVEKVDLVVSESFTTEVDELIS